MAEPMMLPWRKLWDFVSACSQEADFYQSYRTATREISRLIPCEQSFAMFFEFSSGMGLARVAVEHHNVPEKAVVAYRNYYFYKDLAREGATPTTPLYQVDWRNREFSGSEIARDYVHALLRMDMTGGLAVIDPAGPGGMCFGIGRTRTGKLNRREEALLLALRPHLVNLYTIHKKISSLSADHLFAAELAKESELLSKREAEVAGLLCKRLHTREIATRLMISKRTVETHVQHIYYKLHVNSRVELLHKLLGERLTNS